jgi:Protein of unknown function (DUF1236)
MKRFWHGTIGLALVVSCGATGAVASAAGFTWITDGLTVAQRQEIWQGASKQAVGESSLPAGYTAEIGEGVPSSTKLQPIPKDVSDRVPAVKPYDFAMLRNQLLIVDPDTKKVIDIITK